MECRTSLKNQKEKKGGPQPKRGQVKAKIFSMLFQSLIPKGSKKNGEKKRGQVKAKIFSMLFQSLIPKGSKKKGEKKLGECERADTPAPNPAFRIEWCLHSEYKQLLLWKGLVKADGSSADASPEKSGVAN